MKLIVRADDFGYCEAVNRGILDCIQHGIVTTVELMVDMPGSLQAAKMIKDYPEIAVALHCHYQGKACADPVLIPSLIDEDGNLIMRKKRKTDPSYKPNLDEMFIEYKAQIARFKELLGRYPDYLKPIGPNAKRMKAYAEELGIPCDYRGGYEIGDKPIYPDPKWAHLDYYTVPVVITKEQEKLENQHKVDSIGYFLHDEAGILTNGHQVVEMVMHPGWLDDYVLENSSYSFIRVKDLIALKSPEVKAWIQEHQIELSSAYDVLHNTHHYQDYLIRRGGL